MLGLNVPNVLEPIGLEEAGRLIWSTLLLFGGIAIAFAMTRRPKPAEPPTWAQAMLGAVGVLALMVLAYGTVPHEWLTYSSSALNWGKDTFFVRDSSVVPFDIDRRSGADAVAALIYVVFLVAQVWLTALWQKRPAADAAAEAAPSEPRAPGLLRRRFARTSAYGRPVATQE